MQDSLARSQARTDQRAAMHSLRAENYPRRMQPYDIDEPVDILIAPPRAGFWRVLQLTFYCLVSVCLLTAVLPMALLSLSYYGLM